MARGRLEHTLAVEVRAIFSVEGDDDNASGVPPRDHPQSGADGGRLGRARPGLHHGVAPVLVGEAQVLEPIAIRSGVRV